MKKGLKGLSVAAVGIIIIGLIIGSVYIFEFNDKNYTVKITEKERINSEQDSKYLIWGIDKNGEELVFENKDSMFRAKFDSSSVYGKLKKGKTYKLTVVGYRIPFFSTYENIIDFKEIKND